MTTMLGFRSARSVPLNNTASRFTKGLTRVFMGVGNFQIRFARVHVNAHNAIDNMGKSPMLTIIYSRPRITVHVLQYELPISYIWR